MTITERDRDTLRDRIAELISLAIKGDALTAEDMLRVSVIAATARLLMQRRDSMLAQQCAEVHHD